MPTDVPIACALSGGDREARATAIRELGGRALIGVEAGDRRARLRFHGERERIEALVAAERQCCGFFQFTMTGDGEETELDIRTPEGSEPILRALVAAIVAGCGEENSIERPSAESFRADYFLLLRFSATAARMRFFSAPSLIFSFSLMSMARLTFPPRLELNRPEGSFKAAP
jgi:hypothetical protein